MVRFLISMAFWGAVLIRERCLLATSFAGLKVDSAALNYDPAVVRKNTVVLF